MELPMPINPFKLERFFARYEFSVKYLLSSSDCESLSMAELLAMASPESLALWNDLRLGYTESPGHPLLRAEVTRLYDAILPENIIIAAPEEAIFIAMHSLLSAGDHVIVLTPTYQSLYEVARSIGCQVTPWTLYPGQGDWRLDLEQLKGSFTDQTRLLVLNFPNNPTGYLTSRPEFDLILDLARAHGCYIFSDEMYRLLEYDPTLRLPSVCDVYEKGISLSGLSKSFALPGLRMGWLATQDSQLTARFLAVKDYTTICNSAPSEILALIALQNKERILRRNLDIIRHNLAIAKQFFSAHPGLFAWIDPQAGSIAFPEWLGQGTVEAFCQHVLESQGVMIVPGSLFDYPGNHFRIGLGRENFAEALGHIGEELL
jgi:aspartate/methionine/tyrosine aminotransferase